MNDRADTRPVWPSRHGDIDLRPFSARRDQTRQTLQRSAEVLMSRRAKLTIGAIVDLAGMSRGAFYSNYASPDELIAEVLSRRTDRILERISEFIARADLAPPANRHDLVFSIEACCNSDLDFVWVQARARLLDSSDDRAYLASRKDTKLLINALAQLLMASSNETGLPRDEAAVCAHALIAMQVGVISLDLTPEDTVRVRRRAMTDFLSVRLPA